MADQLETGCVTPEFRCSYAHVWEKHTDQHGNEKFSVSMIFEDGADLAQIKKCIKNALINKYGVEDSKGKKKAAESIKELLMRGAEERPDDEAYADSTFMTAKSDNKVGVVELVQGAIEPITDQDDFYSGCYARAKIRIYIPKKFDRVCCALNNIMKTGEGDPLSGGSKAEDDFAAYAGNESAKTEDEDWM